MIIKIYRWDYSIYLSLFILFYRLFYLLFIHLWMVGYPPVVMYVIIPNSTSLSLPYISETRKLCSKLSTAMFQQIEK